MIERRAFSREETKLGTMKYTYDAGNPGMKAVLLRPSFVKQDWVAGSGSPSPTPPSPEENIKETPRAPSEDISRVGNAPYRLMHSPS